LSPDTYIWCALFIRNSRIDYCSDLLFVYH
jgi:hypothetical protein